MNILKTILSVILLIVTLGNTKFYDFDGGVTYHRWYKFHRKNGPAWIQKSGYQYWFQRGKLHREDGPAIEYANGEHSYYLNDVYYTKRKWEVVRQQWIFDNNIKKLTK